MECETSLTSSAAPVKQHVKDKLRKEPIVLSQDCMNYMKEKIDVWMSQKEQRMNLLKSQYKSARECDNVPTEEISVENKSTVLQLQTPQEAGFTPDVTSLPNFISLNGAHVLILNDVPDNICQMPEGTTQQRGVVKPGFASKDTLYMLPVQHQTWDPSGVQCQRPDYEGVQTVENDLLYIPTQCVSEDGVYEDVIEEKFVVEETDFSNAGDLSETAGHVRSDIPEEDAERTEISSNTIHSQNLKPDVPNSPNSNGQYERSADVMNSRLQLPSVPPVQFGPRFETSIQTNNTYNNLAENNVCVNSYTIATGMPNNVLLPSYIIIPPFLQDSFNVQQFSTESVPTMVANGGNIVNITSVSPLVLRSGQVKRYGGAKRVARQKQALRFEASEPRVSEAVRNEQSYVDDTLECVLPVASNTDAPVQSIDLDCGNSVNMRKIQYDDPFAKQSERIDSRFSDLSSISDCFGSKRLSVIFDPALRKYKRYKCKQCNKMYHAFSDFKTHLNHHLQETKRNISTTKPKLRKVFRCDTCGDVLSSRTKLIKHFRMQHNIESGSCKLCELCGEMVKSRLLLKHLSAVHDQSPWVCGKCGRRFSGISKYKSHMQWHNGYYDKTFICDTCSKVFNNRKDFSKHYEIHMEKKFLCFVCGRLFLTNDRLVDHIRTHTGEKPVPCKFCSMHFRQRSARSLHYKLYHREEILKNTMEN